MAEKGYLWDIENAIIKLFKCVFTIKHFLYFVNFYCRYLKESDWLYQVPDVWFILEFMLGHTPSHSQIQGFDWRNLMEFQYFAHTIFPLREGFGRCWSSMTICQPFPMINSAASGSLQVLFPQHLKSCSFSWQLIYHTEDMASYFFQIFVSSFLLVGDICYNILSSVPLSNCPLYVIVPVVLMRNVLNFDKFLRYVEWITH